MNSIGRRLRYLRERCGFTRKDVKSISNGEINASTIGNYENDISQVSLKALETLVDFYRSHGASATYDWIITGKGIGPIDADNSTSNVTAAKECGYFMQVNEKARVITATSDRFFPYIKIGDFLGVIKREYFTDTLKLYVTKDGNDKYDLLLGKVSNGNNIIFDIEKNDISNMYKTEDKELFELVWIRKQF